MLAPIIPFQVVWGFHILITVTNLFGLLFSALWVFYISCEVKRIQRILKRLKLQILAEEIMHKMKEMRTKLHKYYFYLAVMVIEALHVLFRLIIYIVFTGLDFDSYLQAANDNLTNSSVTYEDKCIFVEEFNEAFNFIERAEPYQFIWIGLSHCLILALMLSLIVTMFFLRETYSYYDRDYKLIKFWIKFGVVQFSMVFVFLSIPYIAMMGSVLFTTFSFIDFAGLVYAGKRLHVILKMRLFDLQWEPDKYDSFKRRLLRFKWLYIFLISLLIYLIGIVLAHLAIWLSVSPCYFNRFFFYPYTLPHVYNILNSASFFWVLDYLAILQFDIVLVGGNLIYLLYAKLTQKSANKETKRLLNDYTNELLGRPRYNTL